MGRTLAALIDGSKPEAAGRDQREEMSVGWLVQWVISAVALAGAGSSGADLVTENALAAGGLRVRVQCGAVPIAVEERECLGCSYVLKKKYETENLAWQLEDPKGQMRRDGFPTYREVYV